MTAKQSENLRKEFEIEAIKTQDGLTALINLYVRHSNAYENHLKKKGRKKANALYTREKEIIQICQCMIAYRCVREHGYVYDDGLWTKINTNTKA